MNKERLKTFWKDHKTKIVFGATTMTVGIACYLLGKSHGCPIKIPESRNIRLPIPKGMRVGDWTSFWVNQDGTVYGNIDDIHVQFMGELGENIFDFCEDAGLDQVVYDCPVDIMFRLRTDK